MLNTNQINYGILGPTEEELEAMFTDYREELEALDEKFGKYRKRFELESRSIRERYKLACEHEIHKLADLYERKWKVTKGFPSFLGKEAA